MKWGEVNVCTHCPRKGLPSILALTLRMTLVNENRTYLMEVQSYSQWIPYHFTIDAHGAQVLAQRGVKKWIINYKSFMTQILRLPSK